VRQWTVALKAKRLRFMRRDYTPRGYMSIDAEWSRRVSSG
jgi:hypothetical protein